MREWEFDVAQHERMGGASVEALRLFEVSRHFMAQYYREVLGEGGCLGAVLNSLEGPNKYAVAYRTAFGRDLEPGPAMFLARQVFTADPQAFHAKKLYIEPEYDLAANHFGVLFPLVPPQWKPAVFTAWRRLAPDPLAEPQRPMTGYPYDSHPAWTFVSYPLDPPVATNALPLAWRADDHGWCGFRNQGDFVTQVALRRGPTGGEGAGGFRIRGFGQEWAPGGNVMRLFENVVQLPEDDLNADGRARLVSYRAEPDGSGCVVMDLGDVYAKPSRDLYERHGSVRVAPNLKPSGIRGTRAFAVDYSGKSGAPCLVVIRDRIEGAKRTLWSWPAVYEQVVLGSVRQWAPEGKPYEAFTQDELRELARKPAKRPAAPSEDSIGASDVQPLIDGNTFTIQKGDATLRGTLVRPAQAALSGEALERYTLGAKHTLVRYTSRGVIAPGAGDFLAVITIGKGEAPAVKATGSETDPRITVGRRTIRLAGDGVALGD